jgi:hypothetical protein
MFEDNDLFSPARQVQQVTDWQGQRKQYRAQALVALRKREGLPGPVDETGAPLETRFDDEGNAHYYDAQGNKVDKVLFAGTGKDGKPGGFAIGKRKGAGRTEAEAEWGNERARDELFSRPIPLGSNTKGVLPEFEILEVSEDGKHIEDELRDLNRDSANYTQAEKVSHGSASQQAPDFELSGTSDEEVDSALQEYLKRGK